MEPNGIYNNRLDDLTRVEGTYEFRAIATYGEGCNTRREAFWSIHVEPGIDPGRSNVNVINVTTQADGQHGILVIQPRDRYGNPLGPGRGDKFTVSPIPGVRLDGDVKDRGDGSYGVSVSGMTRSRPSRAYWSINPIAVLSLCRRHPACRPIRNPTATRPRKNSWIVWGSTIRM
jgi:hypothetical protein